MSLQTAVGGNRSRTAVDDGVRRWCHLVMPARIRSKYGPKLVQPVKFFQLSHSTQMPECLGTRLVGTPQVEECFERQKRRSNRTSANKPNRNWSLRSCWKIWTREWWKAIETSCMACIVAWCAWLFAIRQPALVELVGGRWWSQATGLLNLESLR